MAAAHQIEHRNMQTQTPNSDVKMGHINERKSSKSTAAVTSSTAMPSNKRPSSLKLPEHAKNRSKHLYRSRTKPEEPTSMLTDFQLDGNVDDIFVISTEADVVKTSDAKMITD